jgi:hypothetical protein
LALNRAEVTAGMVVSILDDVSVAC